MTRAALQAVEPCALAAEAREVRPARDLFGCRGALPALAVTRAAAVQTAARAALEEGAEALLVATCALEPELADTRFALAFGAADLAREASRQAGRGGVVALVRHADAGQLAGFLAGGVAALVIATEVAADAALAAAEREAGMRRPCFGPDLLTAVPAGTGRWALDGPGVERLRAALAAPGPRRPAVVRADEESQTPSSLLPSSTPSAPAA